MSKIEEARAAGYSDAEILDYMSKSQPKLADALKEGYSPAEILGHLSKSGPALPPTKQEVPERSLGDASLNAVRNFPSSAANVVKGLASAVANPGQTAGTMNDLLRGALMKVPGAKFNLSPEDTARAEATVNALANDYGETYGSWKGFKNKLANDPLSPILDVSTLLSGGAAAAGKASTVGKIATAANPMRAVEVPVNALASYGAKAAGSVNDLVRGRSAEIAAGNIAREAAGPDLAIIQAANRANPDAPASVAAAGVSGDAYQALAARGTRPDMSATAAQLAQYESDMMRFGDRLQPELRADLQRKINTAKAQLDSVNLNAEQAAAGQGAVNQLTSNLPNKATRLPEIPYLGKMSVGLRLANGALDLIQGSGKFKAETLQKIADGMASGKSANQLLATLPTSEQSKLLQLLQSKPNWLTKPEVIGTGQGVNMLNRSEVEQ